MSAQALKAGSIVGDRYRVERILGQGGLGMVYLARDLTNGDMPVALKVLASRKPADAELSTLRQEFSLLSRLRHPNLVRILDFGLIDGSHNPYLVEEYIEGQEPCGASSEVTFGLSGTTQSDMIRGACLVTLNFSLSVPNGPVFEP